jgi:hypothetical protein
MSYIVSATILEVDSSENYKLLFNVSLLNNAFEISAVIIIFILKCSSLLLA